MKAETRVLRSALMLHRLRQKALEKPHSAKGMLGPSLGESPDTPSLGRRVALGRGLIVDDAGKLRCPAGTPNANQFTDLQMSNCMIPSAETAVNEAVDAIGNAISAVAETSTGGKKRDFTPSPDSRRIESRNSEILSSIKAQGGHLDGVTPEYIEEHQSSLLTLGSGLMTKQQHTENRKRAMRANIDLIKQAILRRDSNEPFSLEETQAIIAARKPMASAMSGITSGGFSGTPEEFDALMSDLQLNVFGGRLTEDMPTVGLSEKTIEFLRNSSPEEIEAELEKAVRSFHDGLDPRVHVQIPAGRLSSMFSDGRYKTTHEARSDHSGADVRTNYETLVGLPPSSTEDVRPASGFVVHKDWQAIIEKRRAEEFGKSQMPETATAENVASTIAPYGHVGVYGNVTMRLKPEVSERTRYGWGDSFNNMIDPVSMSPDADIDELGNALLSRRFKNGGRSENMRAAMSFLDAHLAGDFGLLRSSHATDSSVTRKSPFNDDSYAEALVFGSFELADVAEIEMDWKTMPWAPRSIFPDGGPTNAQPDDAAVASFETSMQTLFETTLNADFLKTLGATDEEIAEIQSLVDKYMMSISNERRTKMPSSTEIGWATNERIHDYLSILAQQELMDDAAKYGTKVKFTSPRGLSRFDITHYSESDQKIGDVKEIWRRRVAAAAIEDARNAIKARSKPAPTGGSPI